jgi:hypothetical protein
MKLAKIIPMQAKSFYPRDLARAFKSNLLKIIKMLKINSALMALATFALVLFSNVCFSQTLQLGSLSPFGVYTVSGAITNLGNLEGDAGSNFGVISGSGFGPDYTGTVYESDAVTADAKIDLLRVYIHLSDVFVTDRSTHAAAFGNGETITPGVYTQIGAGSVAGDLILDGEDDPNAFFILKFNGAFTIGASANIVLTGGLEAANVFWIAEGAIDVAVNATVRGTLFSHPGAISLGTDVTLEGRMLASQGAITIAGGCVVTIPAGDINIPINCLSNCAPSPAVDVLGSVSQFALYTSAGAVTNAASSGIVGNIGTNGGAISGFGTTIHVGFMSTEDDVTAQAKIELDSAYIKLMALPNDSVHAAAFGSGETVFAGVYHITGAGSLSGTITLDAQGDPDAIFVFRFGGAFSVAAQSSVIFANGTRRCNVFWIGGAGVATGAVSIGTFTFMKGTVLAHGGACTMAAGGNLEGRLLSTAGAIGFSTGLGYNDPLCFQDIIVTSEDQTECLLDSTTLTAKATASSMNQNMVWYDAEVGGNVVDPPIQEGVGSVTLYAAAFNGAYYSETRGVSTLTISDCSIVIDAVEETTEPVNGITGGETTSLTSNDTLYGEPIIIGTAEANITLTEVAIPEGFTLNADGTVTIPPNTPAGNYSVEYQICEVSNPDNCDSAISIVVVSAIGCLDSEACNYHPDALTDDGSCLYLDECGECGGSSTSGCTEASACNYDPTASCDDDSCHFASNVYYEDADNDLFGDEFSSITECGAAPVGYVTDNTDCDDTNDQIYPEAPGTGEGFDNDCNGTIDTDEGNSCLGDFDFNGIINIQDLLIFLGDFGCDSDCFGDLNGDDMTNASDILIFLGMFGSSCP